MIIKRTQINSYMLALESKTYKSNANVNDTNGKRMKLTITRCTLWQPQSSRKRLLRLKKKWKPFTSFSREKKKLPDLVERIPSMRQHCVR